MGRDSELARVTDLVSGLGPESGFALVVAGEAGMGKSAFLEALAATPAVRVLRASGVLSETHIAFAGLQELLTPIVDHAVVLPPRPQLALRRCLALEPGATDETASFVALVMLLAAAADESPLLCLVDDVHWLDECSVDALLFAARRHPRGVGFVFAVRSDSASRFDESWLPRLTLGPLEEVACRAILARRMPTLTAIEVDRVVHASEGCPLAVVEFGHAVAHNAAGAADMPLPLRAGLDQAFGAAVRALPDDTRRALLVLAAADTERVGQLGRAIAEFAGDAAALDAAIDERLVISTATHLRFRHPLVRAAAYQSAPRSLQRAAHRLLADVLEESEPERAAWHRAAAADQPSEEVALALVRTAHVARQRGGYATELRALERAARLTPDAAVSRMRLAAAAAAALQAGKHEHAEALLHEVIRHCEDPIVLADAEHELAQIAFWRDGRRLPTIASAVARVAPVDPSRAARLLSFDLVSLISDYQARMALPIALRARELTGDAVEPFEVAFRVAHVLIMAGCTTEGALLTSRVAAAAETSGNPAAAVNIAQPCIWLERYEHARSLLSSAASALRAVDALWMLGHALVARAELERRVGNLTAARLAAGEALALAEQLDEPMQQAEALVQLAAVEAEMGQTVQCRAHAQRAARLAESRECGTGELISLGAAAIGRLALASGRPAETVACLEGPVSDVLGGGVADPAVVPWVVDLVEAYARERRTTDAERLSSWLAARADLCDRAWAKQAALRCDVLLHDSPDSRERLAASLRAHQPATRMQTGHDWLTLGAAQRRAGQRSLAREALRKAHAIFSAAGALDWSERAAVELRTIGARTANTHPDPVNCLTPQETRVAQLVAGGARNREAAASLFVTPKTIETHLAAIYRKLGVRSRTELAGRLGHATPDGRSQGFT